MFALLGWIIVGGIAGWVASILLKTNDQQGCVLNIIVGMVGSLIAGTLVTLLTTGTLDFFNTAFTSFSLISILASVVGAVLFLWVIKVVRR